MRNIRFKWTQSSKETFDSLGHTCFARWALAPYTSSSLPLPCSLYLPLTMAIIITNWLCLLCQALFGFLENLLILHWIKIKICLHGLRQLSSPLGSTLLPLLLLWPEIVFASATAATATMNSSSNIAIFNALPQFIIFVHQLSLPSTHLPPSSSLPLPLHCP